MSLSEMLTCVSLREGKLPEKKIPDGFQANGDGAGEDTAEVIAVEQGRGRERERERERERKREREREQDNTCV